MQLVLIRSAIAGDRIHLAVDQSRRHCTALGVNEGAWPFGFEFLLTAGSRDTAIYGERAVPIGDRRFQLSVGSRPMLRVPKTASEVFASITVPSSPVGCSTNGPI